MVMGELVTAKANSVPSVIIVMKDFIEPTEAFITSFGKHVDISGLPEHGINLALIQNMLRWIPSLPAISMPNMVNKRTLGNVIGNLLQAAAFEGRIKIDEEIDTHRIVIRWNYSRMARLALQFRSTSY